MQTGPSGCLHYRSLVPDPEPSPPAPDGAQPGRTPGLYRRLRSPGRLRAAVDYLAVAVLAFVPMLASQPGTVTDDTKTYLYLDPGRYVRQAVSLWDPNVGLGTVTHENIGYLLPMGPFYWVLAELHVPLWIAQRLWMGTLLFAAGAGVVYLCRTLGLTGPGRYVATVAFMFTPYVLQYAGRISVILMPWAGLPWMIAFAVLALRRGGWRYPALFALVVALVSGINASSILYVGVGPALYLPYAVLVAREATWRRAWGAAWRIGLLSALVSLWWAVGLQVEAAYGVNVLKYTETVPATSSTSVASEIVRGLGYWYFYGSDRAGSWTQASVAYTQNAWLVAMSFVVPVLALVAAAFVRWRQRAYFALLVVVGMVLAVGAYPFDHPSGVGSLLKALMVDTTAGLAMRSTDRASPLILLSLAMFLGAGVSALSRRVRRTGLVIGGFALAAVAGATVPLWTGAIIANGFTQPAKPPAYVVEAANALDAKGDATRVYGLPGNNFAAYRWGDTIDTVYPALMTRPFVTHEQQIMGSLATADVLNAVDNPLQNGTMDWNTLAPMASLMSAGDVLVQYDQQYERYDVPNPQQVALELGTTPPGLSDPVSYGAPVPNISSVPFLDEGALARPTNQGWTAPLVSYTVASPRPIVRTESLNQPLVVDGDANGLVSASSVGLLAGNPTILYAGTLDTDPGLRTATLTHPAGLVVTDTNRKQAFEWNTLSENAGYTETAAQGPDTADLKDAPIDLFPKAPADAQTTTVLAGVDSVTASSYGSSLTYLPEDRPAAALDGNPDTAWVADSFTLPTGQWWQVKLTNPATVGSLHLTQPTASDADRWITRVTLTFDGGHPVSVDLGPASRTAAGQEVTFPTRTFSTLRITISGYQVARRHAATIYESAVGFAEVGIPGVRVDETVSMPQDLLRASGSSSLLDPLTLLMTRLRTSGFPPRTDPETTLARTFWLPTARTFQLTGTARISPLVPDDEIDRLVGRPGSDHTGVVAYSQGRLPGDLTKGAINTIDGNPATIWEPGFGAAHQAGEWLEYDLPRPITFHTLDLQVVADGEHSVPTSLTVTTASGSDHVVLPAIADGRVPGSVVDVPLTIPALTGQTVRITFDTVRLEYTNNYDSESPEAMPIGIAEVGIPPLQALWQPVPARIPTTCTDTLLAVDGSPIWVQVSGSSADALARNGLLVSLCGPDAAGLTLGAGDHTLTSAPGGSVGFDTDQVALASAAGGAAAAVGPTGQLASPPITPTPPASVTAQTSTTLHVAVTGVTTSTAPFALVMGQSINPGWVATVDGRSLGTPTLVDGFANAWTVDPAALDGSLHGTTLPVTLRWVPQRRVNVALVVSALFIVVCLVLAFLPRRRRRLPRRPRWLPRSGAWTALRWPGWLRRATAPKPRPVPDVGPDDTPLLAVPFAAEGPRAPVAVSLLVGVVTGGVAAAIAAPVAGAAVGVGTVVALLVPRTRFLLGLAAAGLVAAAGGYVLVVQAHQHFDASGTWPTHFETAGALVWAGVVFLGADATVESVRRRQARRSAERGTGPVGGPSDPAGPGSPDGGVDELELQGADTR